jgi:uncharacterized protein (DUF2235 family)
MNHSGNKTKTVRVSLGAVILAATTTLLTGCHTPSEINSYPGHASKKSIAAYCDGTWNIPTDHTNVRLLWDQAGKRIAEDKTNNAPQGLVAIYHNGVGTDWRKYTGGILGYGEARLARTVYADIARNYQPGDTIYIFGFSRGAFTARCVAGMIQFCGLPDTTRYDAGDVANGKHEFRNDVEEAFKIYKDYGKLTNRLSSLNSLWRNPANAEKNRNKIKGRFHTHVPVEVVGVFDTVAALGIPNGQPEPKYLIDIKYLPNVKRAYQALALDERRSDFYPLTWGTNSLPSQTVEEMWFAGAHSDIGGGYSETNNARLANISQNWMAGNIKNDGLLPSDYPFYSGDNFAVVAKEGVMHDQTTGKLWHLIPGKAGLVRDDKLLLTPDAKVHKTVEIRLKAGAVPFLEKTNEPYQPRQKSLTDGSRTFVWE